jgi:hypothetical protein
MEQPPQETGENLEEHTKTIRLVWDSPAELNTIYANHLAVSHAGSEFYLIFGELPMPLDLGYDGVPDEVRVIPKVRIAVSKEAMGRIIDVLQDSYEEHKGSE